MTRPKKKTAPAVSRASDSNTPDSNRIVHGLWIGTHLSRLELLTLHSFTRFGHRFQLWVYDDLQTEVPAGVRLRDANEILPRARVFTKADNDAEAGLGKGSYGPFSDLFRYKLLWKHGGIWVDMDVTCLRRFDFKDDYLFRSHRIGMVGNVMKVPASSELMRATFRDVDAVANGHVDWLTPNRILNKHVTRLGLETFIRADISNVDRWTDGVGPFAEGPERIPDDWYCIHWMNEAWRSLKDEVGRIGGRQVVDYVPDKNHPFAGSTLHELYRHYGLIDPREPNAASLQRRDNPQGITWPGSGQQAAYSVLVPNLAGARAVADTVQALGRHKGKAQSVYVVERAREEQTPAQGEETRLNFVAADARDSWHRRIAFDFQSSHAPLLFTHRIAAEDLRRLQNLGVVAVPVVEDAQADWLEPASTYNRLAAPFVVAGCDAVAADLSKAGCRKPIITVRHELAQRFNPQMLARGRSRIRDKHGIDDETVLIGMIGPFTPQKAYTRAVRALAALSKVCKAKLMILGDWDSATGRGRSTYEATMRQAIDARAVADLIVVNDDDRDSYFGAFDVFLNTSVYEAVPLSLMEARLAGCPIVAADVGGNREIAPDDAILIAEEADTGAYVAAILKLLNRRQRVLPAASPEPDLVPRLWPLLARFGGSASTRERAAPSGTLFVTASLHAGGPARSLTNLLTNLSRDEKNILCVLDGISLEHSRRALRAAQIPLLSTQNLSSLADRVEQILNWADQFAVRNICFWNAPPEVKLLIAKVLFARDTKLIDVSPGPMLFDELAAAEPFQRRISFTARQYIERLDTFVSLYRGGTPKKAMGTDARTTRIMPLGVPLPPRFVPLPPPNAMLPARFNPRFAIGTCCRVVPDKRLEFLFDMMKTLVQRVPEASLTIVGGPDAIEMEYWNMLQRRVQDEQLDYIRFVGRHEDVTPFLATFRVFVMVSDRQGCPNASLEALAMKLPVVANPSGGTGEQIKNGKNGYLVEDSAAMAARVAQLLGDARRRRRMGQAGFNIVRTQFSMARMISEYETLLHGEPGIAAARRR